MVGEHTDREPVQLGPAGDQRRAVAGLELVEVAVVDDAGEDVAGVERDAQVGRRDADQLLGVEARRAPVATRRRTELAVVEAADDAAADAQGVDLVDGVVVGEAADPGVHVGAAEALVVAVLAGGHLDERRAAEEHLRALLDHHDVVAHARHVGAAGGRVAEHDGDRRDRLAGQPGEVAERLAAGDEDLALVGEVGAARLDHVDQRQAVLERDLHRPQRLAHGPRRARAAADRRVVGDDHALDVLDDADAGEHAGADREVAAPRGERRQLEQRGVAVDEQLDALAAQQLAALAVALDVLVAAAVVDERQLAVVLGEQLEQVGPVGLVRLAALVDVIPQHRHGRHRRPARAATGADPPTHPSVSCIGASWPPHETLAMH